MIQEIIIFVIFLVAAFYIARVLYRSFAVKSGCAKGCGGACSSIDFKKIQRELDQKAATVK
ncbi:FeoB-associated Cys-rich membrane protein [Pontibacter silvestris]|uniref:FeoB-associated Cys-rich membrane protein n=1 Tax=Pontibacter silvestris TaxID=2305183 RepID=A0ABW4X0Q2_9BACT|nr:FeoB-associated Cys-rich membrane protein [Pontibacter silvestris]MCC9135706.1 FeoB-associated Cys-rich membrane protein [Pontibacter silvestris]